MSYVHEIQTVYHVVQNPQMVLLSEKGAHGVNARCKKVCMLLPQRSQGSTLKIICFSSPIAPLLQANLLSQTNPASPVDMVSTSQTASSNWQAMTTQPKLQKSLHARDTVRRERKRKERHKRDDSVGLIY